MTDLGRQEDADPKTPKFRGWLVDLAVGGIAGALVAAVIAVNFVIFIGVERGYESSLGEVFEHSLVAGIVTVMMLVAGPIVGVLAARRRRAR